MNRWRLRMRTAGVALAILATIAGGRTHATQEQTPLSTDAIRQILVERIDVHRQSVGIVVGVIDSGGRRIVAHGRMAAGNAQPVDGRTMFEIGSVTKVVTSLLLADAVRRGEVTLSDPVSNHLPETVTVPARNGLAITLGHLATHTSGLPRLPTNLVPKDAADPYADYSADQLYAFLSSYQLTRDPGAQFEYSNLGAGLLGHVLSRRAGLDYETLVRTRVLEPLGLEDTTITLSDARRTRLATGHSALLEPVANWELSVLAGAGALRSTADDMVTLLAAVLGYTTSPLAPAMADMLASRTPAGSPSMEIGLGWMVLKALGPDLVWHNGGTGGYRSFLGFNPATRVGVVVLSNAMTPAGVDDIGFHLLDGRSPLIPANSPLLAPPVSRAVVELEPTAFDRYVGRYQLAPGVVVTMTREGSRYFTQLTGQPTLEVFADSATTFFLKVVNAQLTFEVDAAGRATAVVLHQNGRDQRAPRIE